MKLLGGPPIYERYESFKGNALHLEAAEAPTRLAECYEGEIPLLAHDFSPHSSTRLEQLPTKKKVAGATPAADTIVTGT